MILFIYEKQEGGKPCKKYQEDKEMKKVSKPIAIVMALVLTLGAFAANALAAEKVYAHPEGIFTLAGGQDISSAKPVAIGELVYGALEAEGKAVYKIYSEKAQELRLDFDSATPVNVTVSTSDEAATPYTETNKTHFSSNIQLENANYYITVENYVAPVTPPADDNTGDDNTGDDNTGDDNTGSDNTGDSTNPQSAALDLTLNAEDEEEAAVNEFKFSTSVSEMEKEIRVDCNHKSAELVAGQSLQLKLSNFNIENINYFWRVLDDETTLLVDESEIVKVSQDGLVTVQPNSENFNKDTEVKVQAVMYYLNELWTKTVTIKAVPANVFLNPYYDSTEDNCLVLGEGASRVITATTNLKDARITWSTEDAEIATVTAGGKVTGVSIGKTYIKASVKVGEVSVSRRVLVDVKQNHVSVMGIAFDTHSDEIRVNEDKTVAYTFETAPAGKNPTNAKVTFTSSDPAIATVDADGKVTGVAVGTATITVTSEDGQYSDTCTFTIKEAIPNWLMVIIAPFRMIYNLIMMIIGK